jgi:hypothetical protein
MMLPEDYPIGPARVSKFWNDFGAFVLFLFADKFEAGGRQRQLFYKNWPALNSKMNLR